MLSKALAARNPFITVIQQLADDRAQFLPAFTLVGQVLREGFEPVISGADTGFFIPFEPPLECSAKIDRPDALVRIDCRTSRGDRPNTVPAPRV